MRRDVCYFFAADVPTVYNAYLSAATNAQFRRSCNQEPYHTLDFALNFSMKYNMNGGRCTIRFMPLDNGTAVNLRFTIAQAAGARYEKYAKELSDTAGAFLSLPAQSCRVGVEEFLKYENQLTAAPAAPSMPEPAQVVVPTPAPVAAPAPTVAPAPTAASCTGCGAPLRDGDAFCCRCGTKVEAPQPPAPRFCIACGTPLIEGAAFCTSCGKGVGA